MSDQQHKLDEQTIRACADRVKKMQPHDALEPKEVRDMIANQTLFIYHALMTMAEPGRDFKASCEEMRSI